MDIRTFLAAMVEQGASDLYLTVDSSPTLRIEGVNKVLAEPALNAAQTEALAYSLMTERQQAAFQEKLEMNLAIGSDRLGRFRVNVYRQRGAVGVVVRRIKTQIPTLDELGLPPILKQIVLSRRGLVLVTGATASGKSTSLAAMLDYRNQETDGHILSVEDPIEFVHKHKRCIVSQRELGFDTLSFADALKNALRQAPDVILIGEVRDQETMMAAITFAETGHLCLATLHSNNANQAIERVMNFFPATRHPEIYLQRSLNLRAIISQRLVPGLDGKRVAALEVLVDTPWVKDLIKRGEIDTLKEAMEKTNQEGGQTFDQALFEQYAQERISEEQALANADSANNLRLRIRGFDMRYKSPAAREAGSGAGDGFRIEGVAPAPHVRRT